MHNEWGFFVPLRVESGGLPPSVSVRAALTPGGLLNSGGQFFPHMRKPESFGMGPLNASCFNFNGDGDTVRLFLNAVCSEADDPRLYMSKGLAQSVDLNELKGYFCGAVCYACLRTAETVLPGRRKTNSIMIMEQDEDCDIRYNHIIHLHMRREPGLGQWKIYDIEKE